MTYPIIDPNSFGPLEQIVMPNGDIVRGGMVGPDENGVFSLVGIGNYKNSGDWVQFFEYGLDGDSTGILQDLWQPNWNNVAWNGPAPTFFQNPPTTFAQYAASTEATGNAYTTYRNGVATPFYGTQALQNLYADFASTTTTLGVEECLGQWETTVIQAKFNQLWNTTYNVAAPPTGNGFAPPIMPTAPGANVADGLPSPSAMWVAVSTLVRLSSGPALPGSPVANSVVMSFAAAPSS